MWKVLSSKALSTTYIKEGIKKTDHCTQYRGWGQTGVLQSPGRRGLLFTDEGFHSKLVLKVPNLPAAGGFALLNSCLQGEGTGEGRQKRGRHTSETSELYISYNKMSPATRTIPLQSSSSEVE